MTPATTAGVPRAADPAELARWSRDRARVLDPATVSRSMAAAAADNGWQVLEVIAAEPVKERPLRRLTVRYQVRAERRDSPLRQSALTWYGKLQRASRAARAWRTLVTLREVAPVGLEFAEPVAYAEPMRLVVVASLGGVALLDLLHEAAEAEVEARLAALGRGLRALHVLEAGTFGPGVVVEHGPLQEADVLSAALARLADLSLPGRRKRELEEAILETRETLAMPFVPARRATLHRDLHPGQVHCAKRTGLLDVDELASGERELDLGNLAAHLALDDLQRHGTLRAAGARTAAFLEGYGAREFDAARFDLYRRAALLRLATLRRVAAPVLGVLDSAAMAAALLASPFNQ